MAKQWTSQSIGRTFKNRLDTDSSNKSKKAITDPCKILLPVDLNICSTARQFMADGEKPMAAVAACVSQDPVMVLEFLKVVNRLDFAAKEGYVTTLLPALVRLGAQEVIQILYSLRSRPQIKDPCVSFWIDFYRTKGRQLGIVAKIIAEIVVRALQEDCLAAAALMPIGDMLAAAFLEEKYVALAMEVPRAKLIYQLGQKFNFDVETITQRYLNRSGIPEPLVSALNLATKIENPERARSRTVCFAASEMVEAFESDHWNRLEPGRPLPPKSFVRSLWLSQKDYTKVYERVGRFLFELRLAAERMEKGENTESKEPEIESEIQNQQIALGCSIINENGESTTEEDKQSEEPPDKSIS